MRKVENRLVVDWFETATEVALQQIEAHNCKCASCLFLAAIYDARQESSEASRRKR